MGDKADIKLLFSGSRGDEALLQGIRRGDSSAFSTLYAIYAPRIQRLSEVMLDDAASADAIVQETFLRVFKHIHTFEERSGLATWIYRIAVNQCLTELKKRSKRRSFEVPAEDLSDEGPASHELPHHEPSIDTVLAHKTTLASLQGLLATMDDAKRFTFTLYYIEELEIKEIADILGEPRGTVAKRLRVLRDKLRSMMTEADTSPSSAAGDRGREGGT